MASSFCANNGGGAALIGRRRQKRLNGKGFLPATSPQQPHFMPRKVGCGRHLLSKSPFSQCGAVAIGTKALQREELPGETLDISICASFGGSTAGSF